MFEIEAANYNGVEKFDDSATAENRFYTIVPSGVECWLYCLGTTIAYAINGVVYNRNMQVMTGQTVPVWLGKRL